MRVLFLGGLLDADEPLTEFDAVGLGVDDILIIAAASSCEISDMELLSSEMGSIVGRVVSSSEYIASIQKAGICI